MTIGEALNKKVKKVRLPSWNFKAYLELPILDDGKIGPWAKLYDPFVKKEPTAILMMQLMKDYTDLYEEVK